MELPQGRSATARRNKGYLVASYEFERVFELTLTPEQAPRSIPFIHTEELLWDFCELPLERDIFQTLNRQWRKR